MPRQEAFLARASSKSLLHLRSEHQMFGVLHQESWRRKTSQEKEKQFDSVISSPSVEPKKVSNCNFFLWPSWAFFLRFRDSVILAGDVLHLLFEFLLFRGHRRKWERWLASFMSAFNICLFLYLIWWCQLGTHVTKKF